jgi:hypothetical protein
MSEALRATHRNFRAKTIQTLNIESKANELLLRVRLPDFDMSELRAVQYKQQETGFITVQELMKLQKAGFNRPKEVPPSQHRKTDTS